MKKFIRFFIRSLVVMLPVGCSQNVLSELGSRATDDAYLEDAQTAVNIQDYQTAIDLITTKVSADGRQKISAKQILAGAYAGKCGLNFLNFVDSLSTSTTGSAFALVSKPFVGRGVDPDSCLLSLAVIESMGPSATRTSSQNVFAAIVGMSLMGSATRAYTDHAPTTNGDGTQDSVGVSCTLTDLQMNNVVLGFGFMAENFGNLSSSQLGSSSGTALSGIMTMCDQLGGGACNITTVDAVTPGIRAALRRLMNTTEYGIGTVVTGGDAIAIAGACP